MKNYQARPDLLKDRVILVTGAGDGIGAVAAKTFAAHGATVVLLGRTVKKLEKIYDEIKNAGSPEPAIYPLNLEGATARDYDEMAATIKSGLGRLDGIVHNAAILGEPTPLQLYPSDLWKKVMQVNVTAAFMLTQPCLPLLRESPDPRILFTTHRLESAYWGAYGVSKAAVETLMKILADELENEPYVVVNAIEPGDLQSPMIARAWPGKNIKTLPTIESVMPWYLYLIGPDSREETGKVFPAQSVSSEL
jgi:NAD(P)-dependent dehydrogenase (short-subunit alcohol dehydrogenase family)